MEHGGGIYSKVMISLGELQIRDGEDGLLVEVIEGEDDKQKITTKALKARLKEIGRDQDYAEERQALEDYSALLDQQVDAVTEFVSETVEQAVPAFDADDPFVIKRILPIDGPIRYGDWHWDDKGVADGPIVITVDLDARVLSVFKGGYEIGATAVLLGTSEKPTPLGEFPIKWKKADHYSSTYDSAPMPFTQNLTPDGVAIHGTKVEKGYARDRKSVV